MRVRDLSAAQVGAGVTALAITLALGVAVIVVGTTSHAPTATAGGPTATPTKIANDGSLGGVVDILVHAGGNTGQFSCIGKLDHENGSNLLKTALQCYADIDGTLDGPGAPPPWAEVACTSTCPDPDLQNPSELGPDGMAGPPPPPPYTIRPPDKAYGQFYPTGHADCMTHLPTWGATDPCAILTACLEDLGVSAGPNVIMIAYIGDPEDLGGFTAPNDVGGDGQSHGVVDVYNKQANSSCDAGTPKGAPFFLSQNITVWHVYDKAGTTNASAPWRVANPNGSSDPDHDYDGDGCWDEDELDKTYVDPGSGVKCGDDPWNPLDSFDASTADLTGVYSIVSRISRADCTDPQDCANTLEGGIYTDCLAELRHDTDTDDLVMRPYCYADQTITDVNPEAFPGITGDGFPGAPPPGPEVNGAYVYGDVGEKHAELTGTFDTNDNLIHVAGCFLDANTPVGVVDVWFEIDVSAHQRPGTATIYFDEPEDCEGSPVGESPFTSTVSFMKLPKGLSRDDDHDGLPTALELQDDTVCGRRDPFNKNDYYDVSIPRDGVIDLFNDISGTINNYEPDGYDSGDLAFTGPGTLDNYDRPPRLTGSGGGWNRGSPDGVIDLFNDISGVIAQYNPDGVSADACG